MKNQFQTASTASKNMKILLLVWAVMSVLALLGLKVSIVTCIFLECMILFMSLFMLLMVSKTKWILNFENAYLTITNTANHQQYSFEDLNYHDFIFSQNKRQKRSNSGDLKIKGSSAIMNDVQRFEELKAYILENFQ